MFDIIKKTMLTGVGLAAMTRDKVEELAKGLIEMGDMSEEEGKDLIAELQKKSKQAREDLETKVKDMVQKALKKTDVATKRDIARLEKKIKHIEQKESAGNKTSIS